jgi:membrane protein implicated in regulation of membrane protease activity
MKKERKHERFFWILVVTALANVLVTSFAPWPAATLLLVFSVLLLIAIAKWLEAPWIDAHLERWHDKITGRSETETEKLTETE